MNIMKNNRNILVAILITTLIVGGGVYYYFQNFVAPHRIVTESDHKIVVYGDSRNGYDIHRKLVKLISARHPETVFFTGDLVEEGDKPDEWPIFNNITANLRSNTNFYPVLGNHEKDSPLFYNNFQLPGNEEWYSVNSDRVHYTVLNSNKPLGKGSEQYKWLEKDLKSVGSDIKFKVVVLHHPPYSTGKHDEDEMGLRESIVPMFEKYGVEVVFAGHDHDYERSQVDGIHYIVTGGGGAPLYNRSRNDSWSQKFMKTYHYCVVERVDNELKISVYSTKDKLVDSVSIKKK